MKENINALRQAKIDILAKANAILASVPKGQRPTDEQKAKLTEFKNELVQTEETIQLAESFLRDETNPSAAVAAVSDPKKDWRGRPIYGKFSDQLVANGLKPTQPCESLAPFASLGEQMRAVLIAERNHIIDPRLQEISKINAALGGQESVPAEGGFLVIPEFAQGLWKRTYDVSLVAGRCFEMPMTSARLIMHAVDEDSRKDGSRWGGILAYWLAEAGTYQPTKPKFREMQFTANKLIALSYATEEQLADSPAWEAYINEAVPLELAFQIDEAIFNGPGAGAPLGVLQSPALITVTASSPGSNIVVADILQMWSQLWARSRQNAVWFVNQDLEPYLYPMALQNPSGAVLFQSPIYVFPGTPQNPGAYAKLLGRDVVPIEQASSHGTVGDIVLADMTSYILAKRSDVRADTSIHVAFLTGEQAFRFMLRLDGQPAWKKPLTPYQGSVVKSPWITLGARSN